MINYNLYSEAISNDFSLFRCPVSKERLFLENDLLQSQNSNYVYPIKDGIPDFASPTIKDNIKEEIQRFWNNCPNESVKSKAAIGTPEYYSETEEDRFNIHRNFNKPFLKDAIGFNEIKEQRILEIGCGIGLDAIQFARAGNEIYLMDLTLNSLKIALGRFQNEGYKAAACVGDAENLPFNDDSFDVVYSYGVLHHSPNTKGSIQEVNRVLKKNGRAIIMLYSKWSANILFRYFLHFGLLKRKYFKYWNWGEFLSKESELQSKTGNIDNPLTQAFSFRQIKNMFSQFEKVTLEKHFIDRYQMAEARFFLRFMSKTQKAKLHKYLGWNTIIGSVLI